MRTIVLVALALSLLGGPAAASTCEGTSSWSGCSVSNSGSQIDIGASYTESGGGADGHRGGGYDNGGGEEAAPPPVHECTRQSCVVDIVTITDPTVRPATPPAVTIADLASFRPAQPALAGEPAGFGVVGMPTNFTAAASEQQLTGTILGWNVVVRFTPDGYVFDYGDGTSQQTATGGATWDQLGQAQFTPTATSHVYRSRGTYTASVTVQYAAAVDFGTGWRPVPGHVTSTTGGYSVQVVEVRTALVDKTCRERPGAPGC